MREPAIHLGHCRFEHRAAGVVPESRLVVSSQHFDGGKMRALAVTGPRRLDARWSVPMLAELGYPGIEAVTWIGLIAPAGVPMHAFACRTAK